MNLVYHEPRQQYKGYHGAASVCDIKLLETDDEKYIVLFTEIEDNQGTSVTNKSEHLAEGCMAQHTLLTPKNTTFVEHYSVAQRGSLGESWAVITYTWETYARNTETPSVGYTASHPVWLPFATDDIKRIKAAIGEA